MLVASFCLKRSYLKQLIKKKEEERGIPEIAGTGALFIGTNFGDLGQHHIPMTCDNSLVLAFTTR